MSSGVRGCVFVFAAVAEGLGTGGRLRGGLRAGGGWGVGATGALALAGSAGCVTLVLVPVLARQWYPYRKYTYTTHPH